MKISPVVLCGGSGTRLWPLSRKAYPKQFLSVTGDGQSLLQKTILRYGALGGAPILVCNEENRFLVGEQAAQAKVVPQHIVLEPVGKNTAPAICAVALMLNETAPDTVMFVMPSDQLLEVSDSLNKAIECAAEAAAQGKLVTFGIVPSFPATGYGYIQSVGQVAGEARAYPVLRFVEKPDEATAQGFLNEGGYLWNSGMFMFTAATFLEELKRHAPDILEAVERAVKQGKSDLDFFRLDGEAFKACRSDSIDYAIMERTDRAVVVPLDVSWSDVGSWDAVWDVKDKDAQGNAVQGDVVVLDSANNLLVAESRMVAAVGVDDLVIVETADAVMVTKRGNSQDVKKLVEALQASNRSEPSTHRKVFRPWGAYDSVEFGERFQVKRITVNPGAKLSLQMHHHRAEHWIVVSGTAKIRNGNEEYLLAENQSTYIPLGVVHSLENPGKVPLELIEVQSGGYLGEDDIVRLEDRYGRA